MKKLTAIFVLGAIMYSCTENESPDQLNLENQISNSSASGFDDKSVTQIPSKAPKGNSENAMILATFTPINDVSGTYTTETTLLDISYLSCTDFFVHDFVNSVADGTLTLDFDKTMSKRQADVCGWNGAFGNYPEVEGPNPHILFSEGQNSIGITLSKPVKTFGFELITNLFFSTHTIQVDFYSGVNLIGSITRDITNSSFDGARLFAANTDASFDYILVQALDDPLGFSIGQFRYEESNPFTVDVKPDSCENPVNVNSNGVIPVGILASMDLDVNEIDISTIRLNGVAPKTSAIADLGGFYEKEMACDCYPEEFDGIMDLDLKFDTQEIVATLGEVSDGESVNVSLSFETMDGKSWTGEDCIKILKKPSKK